MRGRVLVTGSRGFIGSHLLPALQKSGFSVAGPSLELRDHESILRVAKAETWDLVIHLAGMSHVQKCDEDPAAAYSVNLAGTALLVEALQKAGNRLPHLVFASTAQVYAAPTPANPSDPVQIDENQPVAPQTLYARTKWATELLLKDSAFTRGMPVTALRLFNHAHKSQAPSFFVPHLYQSLLAAKEGRGPRTIPVGNMNLWRDIGALSDLLEAFLAVVSSPAPHSGYEVYNICSGVPKRLSQVAEQLAKKMGVYAEFATDPTKIRPGEPVSVRGSHEKITKALGWKPLQTSEEAFLESFLSDAQADHA